MVQMIPGFGTLLTARPVCPILAGQTENAIGSGARPVPTLITADRLREAVQSGVLISGGDAANVEGIKYDFRMGSRILKGKYSQPIDMNEVPAVERSALSIDPGEVVFVLTQERLSLPADTIAILSPKRKLAHSGIIVLGGLAVDPLFSGPLWIGLYNISSTPFPLMVGRKLIAALFYKLSEQEKGDFAVPESSGVGDFPDELVNLIKNYKPVELKSLADEVANVQSRLETLASELRDDRDWKREFRDALQNQNQQIDKLLEGLREEREVRQEEDKSLRARLDTMSGTFGGLRVVSTIILLIIGAVLGVIATRFLPKMLGW